MCACQYDLRAIKNTLADLFPHGEFLLSAANENDTYTDIQAGARRLMLGARCRLATSRMILACVIRFKALDAWRSMRMRLRMRGVIAAKSLPLPAARAQCITRA